MLMDDTVLMATSREGLREKLNVLAEWCDRSGMVINEDKTEFMAFVTTSVEDRSPIVLKLHHGIVSVTHCKEYKYLGSIFTYETVSLMFWTFRLCVIYHSASYMKHVGIVFTLSGIPYFLSYKKGT